MIAALFVETDGIYYNDPRIEPWDIQTDGRNYKGPHKVIAHPPCKRWGRYWSGGPSVKIRKYKGDDENCFAYSLWAVRTFGGVIEHPEASHAWTWFGLRKPPKSGGWIKADNYGGLTCCVEQGHYGHRARKATWLYTINCKSLELIWGPSEGVRLDEGFRSKEEAIRIRARADYVPRERLNSQERLGTPKEFKELLIKIIDEKRKHQKERWKYQNERWKHQKER